jgi:hypothetical protein
LISWLLDISAFVGAVAITIGCAMIYIPVGVIVAGVMLLGLSLWGAKRWAS